MKKKPEDPKSFPLWQSTFSDLMNLLLCFFVLLFSMSSVDTKKYEVVVQSLSSQFSILPAGGTSVSNTDGSLISSGVSALQQFDAYMNESTGKKGDEKNSGNNADSDKENVGDTGQSKGISDGSSGSENNEGENSGSKDQTDNSEKLSNEELKNQYEEKGISESEKMAEDIENATKASGIQDMVQLDFNGQYVTITLNGSILFNTGKAEIVSDAEPLLNKVANIIGSYGNNLIEVEGHTDSVPIHSPKYESNDVLSMYRALYVANYIRSKTTINPGNIVSTGRGEYDPIASNDTADGRSLNRRVTIKIYNTLSSEISGQSEGTDNTNNITKAN
ncbi:MAG: flagellar motor protein MotB [Lachnospiraceae bacterium]|nr:flagellar motor protein MotB [Lachnospiraceae bacterium]